MEQMSPYTALNESIIMGQIAAIEHLLNQTQSASSISLTTWPHESEVQSSTPSSMRNLLGTEINKIRDMTHTPAGGIDEEKDMVSLAGWLTLSPRSRRSAVTQISDLPPELLVQIFRFYALQVPPWRMSKRRRQGWIAVTHVCQRWREVALGDSSLWARITGFSSRPKWISEMLVRAGNAPLTVDLPVTPVRGVLSKFTLHIFRIRELRLRDLSLLDPPGLREICEWGAPALEHFELGVSTPYPVTFHQLGGMTLFRGWAPRLRTLSLSKVYIPSSLIPRGQLTQLEINLFRELPSPHTPQRDESSQLLDLLINSPDLEVLVLEFCLPTTIFQVPDGWAIHLPCLSRLCLGGPTSRVANLLKMLQLPSPITLRLRCISNPFTDDIDNLLPLVLEHFHNHAPVMFRSLRVTTNGLHGRINMAASTANPESTFSGLHALEDDSDSDSELTVSLDGMPPLHRPTQGILRDVFSMLPISNIEFLSITVPASDPSVKWYELCQRCEKVTTIRASGCGTSDLLQSLKPTKTTFATKWKKWRFFNKAAPAQGGINIAVGNVVITPFFFFFF